LAARLAFRVRSTPLVSFPAQSRHWLSGLALRRGFRIPAVHVSLSIYVTAKTDVRDKMTEAVYKGCPNCDVPHAGDLCQ
jgi:hypothetical protein